MLTDMADASYQRDLGSGLLLRWSTAQDIEDIVYLTSSVFRNKPDDPFDMYIGQLMHQLMSGDHPTMGPDDVAVVEDTRKKEHAIVAMTCLWREIWEYEGISFAIGRPEIVATDPDYRHRGLVRAVFDLVHARSEAEGHLVQGITGIPYFYRQFGYEYALELDTRKTAYLSLIPQAKEGEPEAYTLRDATLEDIPLIQALFERERATYTVSTFIDEHWWRYQIATWQKVSDGHWHIQMISDREGTPQGYVIMPVIRWRQSIPVFDLGVAPGVNLQEMMPSLLRAIQRQGLLMIAPPKAKPVTKISFSLGWLHPAYEVLGKELAIEHNPPYAWYVRVPNLPKFIQHIAPALEQRLANSALAGYNGTLALDFYRGGLRLVFEKGHLITVEDWKAPVWNANENGGFPPLVFLQLLFGYRSLDELRYAFPDVWVDEDVELVLKTLFPKRPSWVLPLG